MKKRRIGLGVYGRGILAIIVGLLMASQPVFIQEKLFQFLGVIFIFGGLISAVSYFRLRSREERSRRGALSNIPFTAIISIVVGIIMLVKYRFMLDMTMFILGFLLILVGIGQLMMMMAVRRSNKFNGWLFVVPVIVMLSGVMICFNPFAVRTSLFMFFGFVAIFYGVTDLLILIAFKDNKKEDVPARTIDITDPRNDDAARLGR